MKARAGSNSTGTAVRGAVVRESAGARVLSRLPIRAIPPNESTHNTSTYAFGATAPPLSNMAARALIFALRASASALAAFSFSSFRFLTASAPDVFWALRFAAAKVSSSLFVSV